MIHQHAKNTWRIMTAAVSGKIQIFVWVFFILLTIPIILVGSAKGRPPRDVTPVLTAFSGFLWFMAGAGCVAMAHAAHQLRLPGVTTSVIRTLCLLFIIMGLLPAVLSDNVVDTCVINFSVMSGVLLLLMLPNQYMALVGLLPMILRSKTIGLGALLNTVYRLPTFHWLLAITLASAALLRWRHIREQSTAAGLRLGLFNAVNTISTAWKNPTSQYSQQFAFLLPRARTGSTRTPTQRMRTLLGAAFAPGAWRLQTASMFVILTVLAWVNKNNTMTSFIFSELFVLFISSFTMIGLTLQFLLLYRRQSNDLAELALLPKLATNDSLLKLLISAVCRVMFFYCVALLLNVSAVLALFGSVTPHILITLTGALLVSALLTVTHILYQIYRQNIAHPLLSQLDLVCAVILALTGLHFTVQGFNEHIVSHTQWGIGLLAITALPATFLSCHWHREIAARPHPFIQE